MPNNLKTTLLLGSLTSLLLGAGYYLGGQNGLTMALVLSVVMNLGSYWFSDKIVLAIYGAKEIQPADNPRLHSMIEKLAAEAKIPKPKIYMANLPVPNAFATGRNKNHAVIAVTPAILQLLDEKELEGVLAHELSHIQNRDILISSIAATLAGAISYLAQMAYWADMFAGGRRDDNRRGSPIGMLALIILTPLIATLIHLAISRSREYQADATGAELSKNPEGLASALLKISQFSKMRPLIGQPRHEASLPASAGAHLFIVNPFKPSLIMSLLSTHPPVGERVRRLRNL